MSRTSQIALAAALAASCMNSASASSPFEGRLANGAPSSTCTVLGVTKCTMFYDSTLNITILNDWNIGKGPWYANSGAGSVQALAASAGLAASGLTGWVLPSGDGSQVAGTQNQYLSIWKDAGASFVGLSGQFAGVLFDDYWSGTDYSFNYAYGFNAGGGYAEYLTKTPIDQYYAVAVRPGDVAAAVPEPQSYAMLLAGLGALMVVVRRRRRR